jgi:hypothetical protein
MVIRLSIDRFEGDWKQVAVLLADDGTPINFPKALLPRGADSGPRRAEVKIGFQAYFHADG